MVAKELDPVRGRELERISRCGRPERGGHRHQVVPAKRLRIPFVPQEAVERLAVRVRVAGGPEEAEDLAQEPRAGPPGAAARPLEPAATGHRERHLRRLGLDAELPEEPGQVRVVRLVVDDEPGVELERIMRDRVRVPPDMPGRLEELDLVEPRQRVCGAEPGDAGTDDRYLHLNGDSSQTSPLDDR